MKIDDVKKIGDSFKNHPIKTVICGIVVLIVFIITAYLTGFLDEKGRQDANSEKTEGSKSIIVHPEQISFRRGPKKSDTYFTVANDTATTQFNVEIQVVLKNLDILFEKILIEEKGRDGEAPKLKVDDILSFQFDVQYVYDIPNEHGENTIKIRIAKLAPTENRTFQITYECNNVQIMKDKGPLVLPLKAVIPKDLGSTIIERHGLGKYQIQIPIEKSIADHMQDWETIGKRPEQNKYLKAAVEYAHAKDYSNAAKMFKKAIEVIPESPPRLAYNYGLCLFMSGAFEKALKEWELVPENERHKYLDVYRGIASWALERQADAVTFMEKAIKDIEPMDAVHWKAKAIWVFARTASSGTDQFAKEAYRFCEAIDKDVRRLIDNVEKPTIGSPDQALGEIRKRQEAAFYVLTVLAERFSRENNFQESLEAAYRAAEYVNGKSQLLINIDEAGYLWFLENLVRSLNNVKGKNRELSRLNTLVTQIEKYSVSQGEQRIADMAMLIRGFYVDGETIRPIKKGVFRLTYVGKCNDDTGLKNLYTESSSYLLGNKIIGLKREREYMFKESISIGPDVVLSEKPYFRIRVEDVAGNTSPWLNMFPFIVATQQGG